MILRLTIIILAHAIQLGIQVNAVRHVGGRSQNKSLNFNFQITIAGKQSGEVDRCTLLISK